MLSIIIPVYNVEKYLPEMLDSVLLQDMPLSDYEIICIDDCSPDNSKHIILEYKKKYPNIVLIEHTENKKVGGARNTGLKHAKGRYIWFVDSDDYIRENCLKELLDTCNTNDLDVLLFNITSVTNEGEFIKYENAFPNQTSVVKGIEYLSEQLSNSLIYNLGYPIRSLCKKQLLLDINNSFPEDISYGEETVFTARAVVNSDRLMAIDESFYFYRQHDSSVSSSLYDQMKGELIFQSIFEAGNLVFDLKNEIKVKSVELSNTLSSGLSWFVNRLFFRALRSTKQQQRILFEEMDLKYSKVDRLKPFFDLKNKCLCYNKFFQLLFIYILSPIYKSVKKIN